MLKIHTSYLMLALITSPIFAHAALSELEKKRIYQEIYAYEGPHVFLLSYYRSGNTWLRYCLEWITQRPSVTSNMHGPIGWLAGFPIDIKKAPIHRAHNRYQTTLYTQTRKAILPNSAVDKLILILRNPHETIERNNEWHNLIKKNAPHAHITRSYFDNIEFFETWPAEKRLLIHYEDLITAPREILTCILNFMDEPLTRLEQFMQEYQDHKKKSVALYVDSISKGEDVLFHSKQIPLETLRVFEAWIEYTYRHIWDTYLKERYAVKS